jgi:two-component system chemotaxis response regulator CheY
MGKHILIVDDSSIMRKMVRKNLEGGGHTIVGEAKNGKEAVDLYRSLKPDVVTMDITMREMDGFTAAEHILSHDANAKIIFLSNLDKERYSENLKRLRALGYLSKNNAKEMLKLIESVK